MNDERVLDVLREAKVLAREYYRLTGSHSVSPVRWPSTKLRAFSVSS
jgi:hypothetical protein